VSKVCRDLLVPRETLASKKSESSKKGAENTVLMVLELGLNRGTVIAPDCVEQPILSSPAEWAEISGDPFPWPGCAE
jgi:hypothetical protein